MSNKYHDGYTDGLSPFRAAEMGAPLKALDAAAFVLGNAVILDKDLSAPPGSPSDLDAYIVGSSATGDWLTHEKDIAWWDDDNSTWRFSTPIEGTKVYVQDEAKDYFYTGSAWEISSGDHTHLPADILNSPYITAMFFPGKPTDAQTVLIHMLTIAMVLPPNLSDSQAEAKTAATGQAAFTLKKNTSSIGTITFSASTTGMISFTATVSFAIGDKLVIEAPGTADTTLADISISLKGTR